MPEGRDEPQIVLIVDDDIPITEVLALVIQELGYRPLVAFNGQQALAIAREYWPALVLTDMMMPILGGRGVVQELREEAIARKIAPPRIIMLTAAIGRPERELSVDAFLSKPFEMNQLEHLIRRLLPPPFST